MEPQKNPKRPTSPSTSDGTGPDKANKKKDKNNMAAKQTSVKSDIEVVELKQTQLIIRNTLLSPVYANSKKNVLRQLLLTAFSDDPYNFITDEVLQTAWLGFGMTGSAEWPVIVSHLLEGWSGDETHLAHWWRGLMSPVTGEWLAALRADHMPISIDLRTVLDDTARHQHTFRGLSELPELDRVRVMLAAYLSSNPQVMAGHNCSVSVHTPFLSWLLYRLSKVYSTQTILSNQVTVELTASRSSKAVKQLLSLSHSWFEHLVLLTASIWQDEACLPPADAVPGAQQLGAAPSLALFVLRSARTNALTPLAKDILAGLVIPARLTLHPEPGLSMPVYAAHAWGSYLRNSIGAANHASNAAVLKEQPGENTVDRRLFFVDENHLLPLDEVESASLDALIAAMQVGDVVVNTGLRVRDISNNDPVLPHEKAMARLDLSLALKGRAEATATRVMHSHLIAEINSDRMAPHALSRYIPTVQARLSMAVRNTSVLNDVKLSSASHPRLVNGPARIVTIKLVGHLKHPSGYLSDIPSDIIKNAAGGRAHTIADAQWEQHDDANRPFATVLVKNNNIEIHVQCRGVILNTTVDREGGRSLLATSDNFQASSAGRLLYDDPLTTTFGFFKALNFAVSGPQSLLQYRRQFTKKASGEGVTSNLLVATPGWTKIVIDGHRRTTVFAKSTAGGVLFPNVTPDAAMKVTGGSSADSHFGSEDRADNASLTVYHAARSGATASDVYMGEELFTPVLKTSIAARTHLKKGTDAAVFQGPRDLYFSVTPHPVFNPDNKVVAVTTLDFLALAHSRAFQNFVNKQQHTAFVVSEAQLTALLLEVYSDLGRVAGIAATAQDCD